MQIALKFSHRWNLHRPQTVFCLMDSSLCAHKIKKQWTKPPWTADSDIAMCVLGRIIMRKLVGLSLLVVLCMGVPMQVRIESS